MIRALWPGQRSKSLPQEMQQRVLNTLAILTRIRTSYSGDFAPFEGIESKSFPEV